jgi:hypothetical protein
VKLEKVFQRRLKTLTEDIERIVQQVMDGKQPQMTLGEILGEPQLLGDEHRSLRPEHWRMPARSRRVH